MSQAPSPQPTREQIFRASTSVVFVLGLWSIGGSNIISYLSAPNTARLDHLALILAPIYLVSAYFMRRQSMLAYLISLIALSISILFSLVTSITNAGQASEIMGSMTFAIAMLLNVVLAFAIWGFLIFGYQRLRKLSLDK